MKKGFRILICAGACTAALLLPAVGLEILLPPVIALAGFMAAEWGFAYLMPVTISGCVGFCVLQPWITKGNLFLSTPAEYCLVAAFVLTILAAWIAMKRKIPNRWALLTYTALICVGIYLSLTADSILAGKPPYTGVVNALQDYDEYLEDVLGEAYTAEARENAVVFIHAMPDLLMMLSLLAAEFLGLAVFIMGRVFYKAFKAEPTKMTEFSLWRLPSSALWGLLLTAAVCALAFILKLSIASSLAFTMGLAFVSMFAVQGASFMSFLFKRTNAPRGLKVFTIIFTVLFMPYTALFLAAVGIYEQIGKKRLLIAAYERQMKLEHGLKSKRDEFEKYGYTRDDPMDNKPDSSDNGDEAGKDDDQQRG